MTQGDTGYTHDLAADVYVYSMTRLKPQTAYTCHVKARAKKGYGAELEKTFWTLGGKEHVEFCLGSTSYLSYVILLKHSIKLKFVMNCVNQNQQR